MAKAVTVNLVQYYNDEMARGFSGTCEYVDRLAQTFWSRFQFDHMAIPGSDYYNDNTRCG